MSYDYGLWGMVATNLLFVIIFLISFVKPKKKYEWRSMGITSGFFVALFAEMYGFPLTIYFLSSVLGYKIPVLNIQMDIFLQFWDWVKTKPYLFARLVVYYLA